MNDSDVFRKSDLGRAEIKNKDLDMLPREARTLLILIDGNKPYQRYFESLDKSKMFVGAGGIAPFFELLQDLQYIELVEEADASSEQTTTAKPVSAEKSNDNLRASQSQVSPPRQPQPSSEAEFQAEFDNKPSNQGSDSVTAIGNYFKPEATDVNYETLRSDLATYIEKNAPPQDAWGYLLSLEQCNGASELLVLVQEIQSATSGTLAREMDEFSKTIKRQL